LTGEVERVTYENEATGFRVIRIGSLEGGGARRGALPAVGTFPAVGPGTRVRVTGEFVQDAKHGEQFRVETLMPIAPSTLAATVRDAVKGGGDRGRRPIRTPNFSHLAVSKWVQSVSVPFHHSLALATTVRRSRVFFVVTLA
jgi:hypothetical protein